MARHTSNLPLVLSLLSVLGVGCPGGSPWDSGDEPPVDDDGDGYAAGDCDDADAGVHPGADDVCGDGVDQDCDGVAASCLEGEHSLDDVGTLISSVALDGPHADLARFAGDLDGDGLDEVAVGQADTDGGLGAVYVLPGAQPLPSEKSNAWLVVHGEDSVAEGVGMDLAGVGDLNGDGLDDLAIAGAAQTADGWIDQVYLLGGDAVAPGGEVSMLDQDLILSADVGEYLWHVERGPQDLTADGEADLIVSGQVAQDGNWVLTAWICAGLMGAERELSDCDARIQDEGYLIGGWLGFGVDVDLNGDGVDDLLTGGPWAEGGDGIVGDPDDGVILAIDGPIAGDYLFQDADHLLWSDQAGAELAMSTELGDVDGDGYDDFMARDYRGYHVVHGPLPTESDSLVSIAVATITGTSSVSALTRVGDVFGDGSADFIVKGEKYSTDAGSTIPFYVAPSDLEGSVLIDDIGRTALLCQGDCLESEGQDTLAGTGDRNGDGVADLLVGSTPGRSNNPVLLYYVPGAGG